MIFGVFLPDSDAEDAVSDILKHVGLVQNFELQAGNVPNAAATIRKSDKKPLVLYNQAFMERIVNSTGTDWAATSILAHEIGHHMLLHTLRPDLKRPEQELQADRFAGHVLYKMGATMEEAQAALNSVAEEVLEDSETHPPKSARLAAVASGWKESKEQDTKITEVATEEEEG